MKVNSVKALHKREQRRIGARQRRRVILRRLFLFTICLQIVYIRFIFIKYNGTIKRKDRSSGTVKPMLFNEFVAGTGCKQTDHNYQVYKELELIYMNTDCTKEHIYEMGRKLVDNSKTEAELMLEAEIKEEIEQHKAEIEKYRSWLPHEEAMLNIWNHNGDKEMIAFYRNNIKFWKQEIRNHRKQINELNWVLA